MAIFFAMSLFFPWTMQTRMSQDNARNLLRLNIQDVRQDVINASDQNLLTLTGEIADILDAQAEEITSELLIDLMARYDVAEINAINASGIITASTCPDFVGYDMTSGGQQQRVAIARALAMKIVDMFLTAFLRTGAGMS